ncbi:MAG TPA: hypothetical protein VF172_07830 [Nitrososphaera sp.]
MINFYFRNKFIDVNIKGTFVEKIPIPDIPLEKEEIRRRYQEVIDCANKILELKRKALDCDLDFSHYLNEPVAGTTSIRPIYDNLSPKDKKALDLASIGRIRNLEVVERDEWIIFSVDWVDNEGNMTEDYEVVRMRITEAPLREFLFGYIRLNQGKFVKGNLLSQILERRIPYFYDDKEKNTSAIKRQMNPYINERDKFNKLCQKIQEAELVIDNAVYDFYSITKEEQQLIEEDSIQPIEIEDPAA